MEIGDPQSDAEFVKHAAREVGCDLVGVADAVRGLGEERLAAWLAAGKAGDMAYMKTLAAARADPNALLAGVRSIVMVGIGYRTAEPAETRPSGAARLSRYCWGDDYHVVLRARLDRLAERLRGRFPSDAFRAVVDSAPLMERDYARVAGLGWFGKNTLLLNRRMGSYFFLGGLLSTRRLAPDAPFEADHCGTCTRCLDACPTQAFDGPYLLDPRKCLSYLTIEHRGPIPEDLAERSGDWIFGCDVCQEVCPWNRKSPTSEVAEFAPRPGAEPLDLRTLLCLDDAEFRRRFRGTPLFRTKRPRVLRNAVIAAVNARGIELLPEIRALADDPDPILAETAAWAVDRLQRPTD